MAAKRKNAAVELAPQADPRAPLDGALLLSKAQILLAELEADLLARARGSGPVRDALRGRHEAERAARRTADPLEVWERHFVTQVAASWVLSCVFVRTLEDRGLLGHSRIAGPGAIDSQRLFFELAPSLTEREYLLTVFRELSRLPAARDLFDARHNPVWMLGPSAEIAKKLLALFRAPNAEAPGLRFGQADTRFLGDLYQDLSADVRERFALLQTPNFVEKYILDRTLERAIARFGLDETTLIDPTCGSGHFLLGAFERLVDHRLRKEPGLDVREAARKALDAVYGADINPYAVAIARFRLTLAFLKKAGYARLADAPALPLRLVVGDSLLHAPQQVHLGDVAGTTKEAWGGAEFALEDEAAAKDVLLRRYAAVVGNPPYITVKDSVLRERYRELYPRSAAGKYSLGAPFTERFFILARSAGFVGTITANSFMRREFGKKLIEQFLPTVNIDGVVNTSGAYIPGHGTPTVLLLGTNEAQQGDDVLTVMAKRGEPTTPVDPEQGFVWRSIADHGSEVGFENDYVSVALVPRATLEKHPWSLGGGGAAELKELLEERATSRLKDVIDVIGVMAVTGEDDFYVWPDRSCLRRQGVEDRDICDFGIGENVREWSVTALAAIYPHDETGAFRDVPSAEKLLWRYRTTLRNCVFFGKLKEERGLSWRQYGAVQKDKFRVRLSIAFPFVATHNHFVLDRGGKVFKQTAPIIKLKDGATEEDHLVLIAYLNSSTACFWLKQVMSQKYSANQKHNSHPARIKYEFAATAMERLPIVLDRRLAPLARKLLELGRCQAELLSGAVVRACLNEKRPFATAIADTFDEWERNRARMVALSETADWAVYEQFGLVPRGTVPDDEIVEALELSAPVGARPFEFQSGHDEGFTERVGVELCRVDHKLVPTRWKTRPALSLAATLETSEFKRTWRLSEANNHPDGEKLKLAGGWCEDWLLDRVEDVVHSLTEVFVSSGPPRTTFAGSDQLASLLERLEVDSLGAVLERAAVPFLAAYRHTDSGLEKRAQWERVWDLQRAEDRDETVLPFDPPPKYDQEDFRDSPSWRLRGKLDVPRERFISYPGCESDEDKEPVYGWAGWNHLQQAHALAALYQRRKTEESWAKERLTPMLAGILELIPWVRQWHNEPSAEFGGLRLGDYFETFLDGECHALGLTPEELNAWRPPEKGRAKKAKKADNAATADGDAPPAKPRRNKRKPATEASET